MKIIKLVNDLTHKPIALIPSFYHTFLQAVKEGAILEVDPKMLEEGAIYREVGNTAIISINGVLLPKASKLEKLFGAASYMDIRKAVKQAETSNVANVIFNFDSPGGIVQGVSETATAIQKLSKAKDTYSFSNGDMTSAAYWLAAQSNSIIASPSSVVGSIGVYLAFLTFERALSNEGIDAHIFQQGKYKTIGLPAKPVTDDERALLQAGVEKSYQAFLGAVSHRKLAESVVQGQVFTGEEALEAGLVDGLQGDLEELVGYLNGN